MSFEIGLRGEESREEWIVRREFVLLRLDECGIGVSLVQLAFDLLPNCQSVLGLVTEGSDTLTVAAPATARLRLFLAASLTCFAFILSTSRGSIPLSLYHCSYCWRAIAAEMS